MLPFRIPFQITSQCATPLISTLLKGLVAGGLQADRTLSALFPKQGFVWLVSDFVEMRISVLQFKSIFAVKMACVGGSWASVIQVMQGFLMRSIQFIYMWADMEEVTDVYSKGQCS